MKTFLRNLKKYVLNEFDFGVDFFFTDNDGFEEDISITRFAHISGEDEIQNRMENRTPLKTRKQNTWGCNVWDEWATWKNTQENNHM